MSNPGFRINCKEIEKPSAELVAQFETIPVANISDTMGRIACMDTRIHAINNVSMVGTAVTVKAPIGDNLMFHKALEMASAGDIVVVDGEGCTNHALCGEMMYQYAKSRGIRGFVVDGCVRDVDGAAALKDFGVYAIGVQPKGPTKNGPGEINFPISAGGIVVEPGDIICCDADGVVVIHPADAQTVLEKAKKHHQMEEEKMSKILTGTLKKDWIDKTLEEKNCEMVR